MTRAKAVPAKLYCLRIELEDLTPSVWRRLWIEDKVNLIKLHHAIQAAMGWTDAHLHEFQIGGVAYATPHPEDEPDRQIIDERGVRLDKVLKGISTFGYTYDFGDHWQHRITVEKIVIATAMSRGYGFVEAGERACPPEDAGGSHGYQDFLDQLTKAPKSKEVREFRRWAGEDFDPNRFDRLAANAALLRMAWNRWGEK
jgi:hypothetical protein